MTVKIGVVIQPEVIIKASVNSRRESFVHAAVPKQASIPLNQVHAFEDGLVTEINDAHKEIIKAIRETKVLSDETAELLSTATKEFKARFVKENKVEGKKD